MAKALCTDCGKEYWAPEPPGAHKLCNPCKDLKFNPPPSLDTDDDYDEDEMPQITFTTPVATKGKRVGKKK